MKKASPLTAFKRFRIGTVGFPHSRKALLGYWAHTAAWARNHGRPLMSALCCVLAVLLVISPFGQDVLASDLYTTTSTDRDGNTMLVSNDVVDTVTYDTAKDSSPAVQEAMGIDPNWKSGVTRKNYALNFDGVDDNVVLASNAIDDPITNQLTIEAWIRPTVSSGGGTRAIVRHAFTASAEGVQFTVSNSGVVSCSLTTTAGNFSTNTVATVVAGTWQHVAMVYDGSALRCGLSGTFVSTSVSGTYVQPASSPFYIGAIAAGASGPFNGQIDEVRYSSAARYSGSFTPARRFVEDASTLGLWHFDDGTGTTVADSSGRGFTGTLKSASSAGDGSTTGPIWGANGQALVEGSGAANVKISPDSSSTNREGYEVKVTGGAGVSFNGSTQYAENTANESAFRFVDQTFTVETWVNTTDTGANKYFISKGAGFWGMFLNSGYLSANLKNSAAGNIVTPLGSVSKGGYVADGLWHHVAAIFTTSSSVAGTMSVSIYMDGKFVDSASASNNGVTGYTGAPSSGFDIGRRTSGDNVAATLDETRVSTGTRYATSGFTPPRRFSADGTTVGLWHMDEGSGSTLIDASSNGYALTLSGSPSYATGVHAAAQTSSTGWALPGYSNRQKLCIGGSGNTTSCSTALGTAISPGYYVQSTLDRGSALQNGQTRPDAKDWRVMWQPSDSKRGLQFSGSQRAIIPDSPTLESNSASVSFWVKGSSSLAANLRIFDHSTNGTVGYQVQTNGSNSDSVSLRLDTSGNTNQLRSISGVLTGAWNHVLITISSGGTVNAYVNGISRISSTSYTASTGIANAAGTNTFVLGDRQTAGGAFTGYLDDFRIYNAALTQTDAQALYNGGSGTSTDGRSSLAAWWRLDEAGSGTTQQLFRDASGNENNGYLGGSTGSDAADPTWVNDGAVTTVQEVPRYIPKGGALQFDGSSTYATLPVNSTLNTVNEADYTLSAWFKPTSNSSNQMVIGKSGQNLGIRYNSGGTFSAYHYTGTSTSVIATSPLSYAAGAWYHVAMTVSKSEGSVALYVNGSRVGLTTFGAGTAGRAYASTPWTVGGVPSCTGCQWYAGGLIDDLGIFSRALSQTEVGTLYAEAAAGAPIYLKSGLVAGYRFDETSGQTLADVSGNGYSAFLGADNTVAAGDATLALNAGASDSASQTYFKVVAPIGSSATDGDYYAYYGKSDETGAAQSVTETALKFDGATGLSQNDNITIAAATPINSVSAFTWSAWIKSNALNAFQRILTKVQREMSIGTDGRLYFQQTFTGGVTAQWMTTSAVFTAGTEYHVAVTYDASSFSNTPIIYINGSSVALTQNSSASSGTFTSDSASPLRIGNTATTFNGTIDDVRMYNRILTASEVSSLNSATPTTSAYGLVGWWKFNDNTGSTAADSSASAGSGTLNSFDFNATSGWTPSGNHPKLTTEPTVSVVSNYAAETESPQFFQWRAYTDPTAQSGSWSASLQMTGGYQALGSSGIKLAFNTQRAFSLNETYRVASWAVEPFNTTAGTAANNIAPRGRARAFPDKVTAVLSGRSTGVGGLDLIDASNNTLWMRLPVTSNATMASNVTQYSVVALNGRIYIGDTNGVRAIDLESDVVYRYSNFPAQIVYNLNIAKRNAGTTSSSPSSGTYATMPANTNSFRLAVAVTPTAPYRTVLVAGAGGSSATSVGGIVFTNETATGLTYSTSVLNPTYTFGSATTIGYGKPALAANGSLYVPKLTSTRALDRFDSIFTMSGNLTSATASYTISSTPALSSDTINSISVQDLGSAVDPAMNAVSVATAAGVDVINEHTTFASGTVARYVGTGTLGTSNWNPKGFGGAASFDGTNDYMAVTDSTAADIAAAGQFTIEAWVKPSSLPAGTGDIYFNYGSATNNAVAVELTSTGTVKCMYRDGNATNLTGITSSSTLSTGRWYHLACVKNATGTALYIDGTLAASNTVTFTTTITLSGGNAPAIGRVSSASSNFFSGMIDEVRLSNTARYTSDFTPQKSEFASDTNTVALYHMNEAGGSVASSVGQYVSDDSLNNLYGTLGGTALAAGDDPSYVFPQLTGAANVSVASFSPSTDRGNGVTFTTASSQKATATLTSHYVGLRTAFTYSLWFKVANLTVVHDLISNNQPYAQRLYVKTDGSIGYQTSLDGTNTGNSGTAVGAVTAGQWYHIVASYDSTNNFKRLYLNGVPLINTTAASPVTNLSSSTFYLASYGTGEYLGGSLDDARIYSRGISGYEAARLYNGGRGSAVGTETGLVAAWNMNEGSGSNLTDSSGNGYTATLSNGPAWTTSTPVRSQPALWAATNDSTTSNSGSLAAISLATGKQLREYTSANTPVARFNPVSLAMGSGGLAAVGFYDSTGTPAGSVWALGTAGYAVDDPLAVSGGVAARIKGQVRIKGGSGTVRVVPGG